MALRFYSEFTNIRRELFKVEIYDSSFSGTSTEFSLIGNGFELQYNGGEETYELIKSSTLSFVMNIDNSTLNSLPSDIASSIDISRFAVKLYRDDVFTPSNNYTPDGSSYSLFWAGCINKRIMSIQDTSYPFNFKVAAVDGIEMLKNHTYSNESNNYVFEERLSVVDFLTKVIDKLDFGDNFSATDIVLATRINWYETNHSLSDSVAAKTYMYEGVFNSIDTDGSIKLSTYYDVLKHICDLFQCRFILYEGKFWYTQFSRLKETSNSYFLYKLNGTTATPITKSINEIKGELGGIYATNNSSSTSEPGFYLREKTFGGRINSVKINWNALADGGQNIYPLAYFPVWQMPNQGWVPYGQNSNGPNLSGYFEDSDEINFKIQVKFSIRVYRNQSSPSTPLTSNDFYGKIVLPFWFLAKDDNNVYTANRWWKAQGGGSPTGVILPIPEDEGGVSGSWNYDSNSYNTATKFKTGLIHIPSSTLFGSEDSEDVFDFDVTITTGIVNVPDVKGVFLYNDYSGGWDSALGTADWFAIEDGFGNLTSADEWDGYTIDPIFNSISIAPYKDGEPYLGSTFDSYVTEGSSNSTNPEELTIDTIKWGDGPSSMGLRTLWINDGSNLVQSNLWQINNTGTTYKIHKLITDEILNYNYFSGERLNATIYQSPNIYLKQNIDLSEGFNRDYYDADGTLVGDEIYCFSSLSYNPNLASWKFKGKKISIPLPTIVTNEPETPVSDSEKASSSISSSVNSFQDEESTAKLNQIISPSDTGTTNLTVTALNTNLENDSILLLQSSNPERSWEKVILSAAASKGDTSLSIDSFNPTYTYDKTSRIILSRETLAICGGGGGTPGVTTTAIYLTPQQFHTTNDSNMVMYTRDDLGSIQGTEYDRKIIYATTFIPLGYKVTTVDIYSSANESIEIKTSRTINDTTISRGTGTSNTTMILSGTGWTSVEGDYVILIYEPGATSDEIYGAKITIEAI